jgi:hypothetical protein
VYSDHGGVNKPAWWKAYASPYIAEGDYTPYQAVPSIDIYLTYNLNNSDVKGDVCV